MTTRTEAIVALSLGTLLLLTGSGLGYGYRDAHGGEDYQRGRMQGIKEVPACTLDRSSWAPNQVYPPFQ